MFFISSKKLFSFPRYSNFCNFVPSFPNDKRTNGSEMIYDVMNWLAKFPDLIVGQLFKTFQYLLLTEFFEWNGCFELFTKIKKGSGTP